MKKKLCIFIQWSVWNRSKLLNQADSKEMSKLTDSLKVYCVFCFLLASSACLLFMSPQHWVEKMDHSVSSLILSPFFLLDPLRLHAFSSLETRHVTFGCQKVKEGPGAAFSGKCRETRTNRTSSAGLRVPRRTCLGSRSPNHKSSQKRFSPGWKSPDSPIRTQSREQQSRN